jgi:CBS domain-containing protein
MKVADLMTRGVLSVAPHDSARKAAELMLRYGVNGFPVLDHGRLVGMVTQGDFLRRVETGTDRPDTKPAGLPADPGQLADAYVHSHARTVAEIMTRDVISISDDAPLSAAVELMLRHQVKRLPVVRENSLIGIISRGDLLHAFLVATPKTAPAPLSDGEIGRQLKAELDQLRWIADGSVEPAVENGVVILHGTIQGVRQRTALRIAAENIPGVKQVIDKLQESDLAVGS